MWLTWIGNWEIPTHPHQSSLVHWPCFFDWLLWTKSTISFEFVFFRTKLSYFGWKPFEWTYKLAELFMFTVSQFEALQISLMFNFESDFSYIASNTTICLFVKNWLVEIHLNFTSVFLFQILPGTEFLRRWSSWNCKWMPYKGPRRRQKPIGLSLKLKPLSHEDESWTNLWDVFGKFWRKGVGVIVGIMIEYIYISLLHSVYNSNWFYIYI